jgi:hypothetical protein
VAKKVSPQYIYDGLSILQSRFANISATFHQEPDKQVNRKQKRQRLNTEKEEYLEQGKTVAQIAKIYGVTRRSIYQHIDRIKKGQRQDLHLSRPSRNYNGFINWKEYNDALVCRGKLFSEISSQLFLQWELGLDCMNRGKKLVHISMQGV